MITDWNGRPIQTARSKSGILLIADFPDNLMRDDALPWPPPAIVQKLYGIRTCGDLLGQPVAQLAHRIEHGLAEADMRDAAGLVGGQLPKLPLADPERLRSVPRPQCQAEHGALEWGTCRGESISHFAPPHTGESLVS